MAGKKRINNAFYCTLKEQWYEESDHPIALLRSENRLRNPWIAGVIQEKLGQNCAVLDIGCGAGFLTNFLALKGHQVAGVDLSAPSLEVAHATDKTKTVDYQVGSAYTLPYPPAHFDAVCAMDLLEHVEDPRQVIQEASRVLKPGGLFFFHTFNRNPLSYIVIIKGVEWCLKNAPTNMHVYSLFLKPKEIRHMCAQAGLRSVEFKGVVPKVFSKPFWRFVFKGKVGDTFEFNFTSSLATGYSGYSKK